jgi:hypothetical protein
VEGLIHVSVPDAFFGVERPTTSIHALFIIKKKQDMMSSSFFKAQFLNGEPQFLSKNEKKSRKFTHFLGKKKHCMQES